MSLDRHDFFVSYNSRDGLAAYEFVMALQRHGFTVWFDRIHLGPGANFIDSLQVAISQATAVMVLIGPTGQGPWQSLEINAALFRAVEHKIALVPVLMPGAPSLPELPLFLKPFSYLDLRDGLTEEAVATLRMSLPQAGPVKMGGTNCKSLAEIIHQATRHIIISGHTLDKFAKNLSAKAALMAAVARGVKLSVVQLNPGCRYAEAHTPFHELESKSTAGQQHANSLRFFDELLETLDADRQHLMEVVFTPYMPRFRAVIVDGDTVYLYLYMYGRDVESIPDLVLRSKGTPDDQLLRLRVINSTMKLLAAPENTAYIRSGMIFKNWRRSKASTWESWTTDERTHLRITHHFYVTYADSFHGRFGHFLEREVRAHLKMTSGRTLVLGCGSGKEVAYLWKRRKGSEIFGVDFSPVAIELARNDPENAPVRNRFFIADFYDLEDIFDGNFDTIVANAAFVHLYARNDIDVMLKSAWNRLNVGGRLFIRHLYKEIKGEPVASDVDVDRTGQWPDVARWFVYFSRTELAQRARNVGFVVLDDATREIAKDVVGGGKRRIDQIMDKGFDHTQFKGVFWPQILLEKQATSQA